MRISMLARFDLSHSSILYLLDAEKRRVGLWMAPTELLGRIERFPGGLAGGGNAAVEVPFEHGQPLWTVDPLVHLQRSGEPYPAFFSQGRTLRNGPCTDAMRYVAQRVVREPDGTTVITELASEDGVTCEHHLSWQTGRNVVRVFTTLANRSPGSVTLEMLTSFSLGGITPFAADDAPGRLVVHRCRSAWAAEGRLCSDTVEHLQLEPSFSRYSAAGERFGQVGTMPVRQFFPFTAVEDVQAGVVWGAQLAWAGSWQMELYRKDNQLCLSGGLADRELGHWTRTLAPGESFCTPAAYLACVRGTVETLCDELTLAQTQAVNGQPAGEQELPIIFNDWCTTWGNPSHTKVAAIAQRLRGSAVKYLVIDAGWYVGHGDWRVHPERFPQGMKAAADAIRAQGLIPGLWFEMEDCTRGSEAFEKTQWHLKRDGKPIETCGRRFWDLRIPEVQEYLAQRVIGTLREYGIGYLKVDYNETIGIGCDGAESLGEGLRQQVEASGRFFARIRRELPELVIENCASGGHRLEPSMLALTAMSSFSDAHESPEIPIIAANLHRLMLPRQSQIWAVLRKGDTEQRLVYSLAATFLGRMCLSGDVAELTEPQWEVYQRAESLYRRVWPIIRDGQSRRHGPPVLSYLHAQGWQAVSRLRQGGQELLVVLHTFAGAAQDIVVPIPGDAWSVAGVFASAGMQHDIRGKDLTARLEPWQGAVLWLRRSGACRDTQ